MARSVLCDTASEAVTLDTSDLIGLIVAILGGAAVGLERQHSGHASGPDARLGGIRTFTLLGTLGGIAGLLMAADYALPASMLIGGGLALTLVGYVRASARDIDATTEVAALVVLGSGVLAGAGQLRLAAALTTLTVLLLAEKPRLHAFVARLDGPTMSAMARFAVMSAVILPLLPVGPFGPEPGVRPRDLWLLVLLFSGMSFVGFILQRVSGAAGYPMTGALGGLVSSTSVTLTFARLSPANPTQAAALATGAIAASSVLFLRVAVAVAIIDARLLPALLTYLAPAFAVSVGALAVAWRSLMTTKIAPTTLKNPLQFRAAIEMAVLFQIVLYVVFGLRSWIGDAGLLTSGFVLGLTDVDALTLSMTRTISSGTAVTIAARAITIGIVGNSLMKAAIALAIGSRAFAWRAAGALLAMAVAGAAALLVW